MTTAGRERLREALLSRIEEYSDDDFATWIDGVPYLVRTGVVDDLRAALAHETSTDVEAVDYETAFMDGYDAADTDMFDDRSEAVEFARSAAALAHDRPSGSGSESPTQEQS